MSKRKFSDLSYGHVGSATYDANPESREWQVERLPGRRRIFQQIRPPSIVLESPLLKPEAPKRNATKRRKGIQDLLKSDPTLSAAISLLQPSALQSEAVLDASAIDDPVTSDLLSFGTAARPGKSESLSHAHTIDIVATAGGYAGEAVALTALQKQPLEWSDGDGVQLATVRPHENVRGWWVGNGTPVHHVCFSVRIDGTPGGWLAVRYSKHTSVLRPLLRSATVPCDIPRNLHRIKSPYPSSVLDANALVDMSVDDTGGAMHVDVTFNPWYDRQLAILDVNGHWTTWNIEGDQRQRNIWVSKCGNFGDISENDDADLKSGRPDGWGAILWAGDENTLVTANRTEISFHAVGAVQNRLEAPLIELSDQEWIFDMKRSSHASGIFVLTSLRILWLKVFSDIERVSEPNPNIAAKLLLSWKHFRSPADGSLRLLVGGHAEDTIVFLSSKLTDIMIGYSFGASSSMEHPQSRSDPFVTILKYPQCKPASGSTQSTRLLHPSTIALRPINYTVASGYESQPSSLSKEPGLSFHQLFILLDDLSILESLYVYSSRYEVFQNHRLVPIGRPRDFKTFARVQDDIFIIPDDQGSDDHSHAIKLRNRRQYRVTTELPQRVGAESFTARELDTRNLIIEAPVDSYSSILNALLEDLDMRGRGNVRTLFEALIDKLPTYDINKVGNNLKEVLDSVMDGVSRPPTADIDEDTNFQIFGRPLINPIHSPIIERILIEPEYMRSAITQPGMTDWETTDSLILTYEQILEVWISGLDSAAAAQRSRINISKQATEAAVGIFTASHGLCAVPPEPSDPELPGADLADDEIILPMRRKASATSLSVMSSAKGKERERLNSPEKQTQSTHLEARMLTPEPTPSLHSNRSYPGKEGQTHKQFEGLRQLAAFPPDALPDVALPQLFHLWLPADNPDTYDRDKNRKAGNNFSDTEDSKDETTRQKRKNAEKRAKRQRVESVGEPLQLTTTLISRSQPLPQAHGIQMSSQITGDAVSRSQIERGPFGDRAGPLKKKKMKRAGF